jgi:alpha,alpha-trehalose phosphorylase
MIEVEIGLQTVTYELREGESLTIHHETEEIKLTRADPRAIRPVSQRKASQ